MTVPRPLFALLVGASSLAIATSGLSQTTPQENPFEQMNQALQAGQSQLQESEFDAAARSFSEVVRIAEALNQTPQLVAGYLGRATALSALEEFEDAKKDYRAAIQENEELAEAHNGLGEILYDESQVLQAYGSFEKAVKRDRSNPVYLLNLGKSQIRIGLAVPAIKSLTKVIEAEPENAEAYSHRGQAQAAIGKFEAAYADMAKAIELDSANHETHYALGLIQMREPNYAGAISAFYDAKERYRPASADEPPYIDPYLGAALAYLELGKAAENQADQKIAYNAAVVDTNRALEEALETQPQRQLALFNRGVAQRLLGQYDEAIESLSEAIAMAPDTFSEGYFRRGIVWHYMNEHNLARLDFEKAISIAFDDPRPNLWLGYTHAALEDYHTATRYYGQALKQDERFVPAYVNRGLAYVQLEDLEKALRDFNEAIRVEPTVADHYYKRGAVQMMTGDYDSAVVSFRNAIQFKSDFREAYERLADSYQAAGDLQAAREVREAAAQLVTSVEGPAASKESGSTLPAPELSPIPDQPANTFQPAQPALDIIENPPAAAAGDAFADPLEAAVADELVPIEESDPTLPLPAEDKERPLNPFE